MVLIVWQKFGMNQSLIVHPQQDKPLIFRQMAAYIEGGQAIGDSQLDDQGNLVIDCPIVNTNSEFLFCSAYIQLTSGEQGLDLSRYNTLSIDLEFESTSRDTILFYLLHHPLPEEQRPYPTKTNMNAVLPSGGQELVVLNLNDFYVPSWWMTYEGDTSTSAKPELTNVFELQIATGDSRSSRNERITVNGIRFDGKWLSSTELNTGIIGFWLLVFAVRFLVRYKSLSDSLHRQKSSVSDLRSLNRLLDIEKKKFATMAKQDHLTKLYNRAGARDILYRVQQAFRQRGLASSLILFDIDDFKYVNDEYGHLVGDKVLEQLAQLLEENTRSYDHVVRWGGEEFAIICEGSDANTTHILADKLRELIAMTVFAENIQFTCSFGVAALKTDDTEDWFHEADKNLYQAKAKGKNCIVTSEPVDQP